jgi:hypothetical protein
MNLNNFKINFDNRHNFNDSDLNILKERFPKIKLKNIPTAWIIPIDEFLSKFRYNQLITEINQFFGFPIISFNKKLNVKEQKIVDKFQETIKNIDKDIRNELEK